MITKELGERELNVEHHFGSMKDSPCQICIVRMLCNKPFGCSELSHFVTSKITIIPQATFELHKKVKEFQRRESCMAKFSTHVKSVLLKLTALLSGIVQD